VFGPRQEMPHTPKWEKLGRKEPMSNRAYSCGLYLPGHDVHWIQAKRSVQEQTQRPSMPGRLLETQPEGLVIIEVQRVIYQLWNHDTDRIQDLVAANQGAISYQPGFGLLRTAASLTSSGTAEQSTPATGASFYLFCVADANDPKLRPCPTNAPSGDLVDLLRNAGGFSVPGGEARTVDFDRKVVPHASRAASCHGQLRGMEPGVVLKL
jgi:hypothetical protein